MITTRTITLPSREITVPAFGTHQTVEDLTRLAQLAGSHFFDANSMRFFRSHVAPDVWPVADGWLTVVTGRANK